MKRIFLLLFVMVSFCIEAQTLPSIHSYTANTIRGKKISLSQFAGKKIMIVNTASFCGYTYQYAGLQLLYQNYKQFNFEIIGFPCNDFGAQEPFSDSIINLFSANSYSVNFTMMSKIKIASGDTAPVYRWLQQANLNGKFNTSVAWNFDKFLINESGQLVKYYPSTTEPTDTAITHWILTPSSEVGINEFLKSDLFKMTSSNPAREFIELQTESPVNSTVCMNLYSPDGKLVKQKTIAANEAQEKISLDVRELNSGIYFLSINFNGFTERKKVLIESPY
ncbi:MAG: T9SS type A sorting domain-containing protein [Bacteroidia bacterium]|nr:T9SS type A sorting domain-containing protein [Bacteroidia bacterium]